MLILCALFVLLCLPSLTMADFSGSIVVIDGDTIDVGDVRVRIHGIDAPEQDQKCTSGQNLSWARGAWVSDQVRERFQGQRATCRRIEIDKYGRVVATCKVNGEDIGRALVSDGLAFAYREYSMAYDLDEKGAAVNDRGLHASRVQSPAQYRKTRAKGRIPPDRNCAIKGNISSSGTRIFHEAGQKFYERTGINTRKGERWFCSVDEAVKAGWRKSRR
ncbi:MAG: endonuclease YncB(thermonuclease family) [Ascidiaceihabitans sp.]|jgi:endonuclease YncB( thermonuclease family)